MKQSAIKAIFFGYDGIISLSSQPLEPICKVLAKETPLEYAQLLDSFLPFVNELHAGKKTYQDLLPIVNEKQGIEISEKTLEKALQATELNKEVIDLARNLKKQGLIIGLITDNTEKRISTVIEKNKLGDIFDPVIVSAQQRQVKNKIGDVKLFGEAIEPKDLVADDCIFIDNDLENLETPEDMGFHTYYYDRVLKDVDALKIYLSGFGLIA